MKISIIAAVTIDGKIAKTANHFPDWTGIADKKMFASITKKAGVIIMGSKTFDLIGTALPERQTIVMTRKKKISQKKIIFSNNSAESIIENLGKKYEQVLICGGSEINHLFINKNLVDELIITFSPLAFGTGISLFSSSVNLNLKLTSVELIDNNSICATYHVVK